jgi:hypothetical protein
MNKKHILLTLSAAFIYITTSSYHGGAAAEGSLNRTGAKASTAGCAGSGCHTGSSPAAVAAIYVDSAGVPVTKYTAGKTYNIRIVGRHSLNDEFGFQFAAVSGTGSAQVQAGTFGTSLPASVQKTVLSGLDLLEHSDHIAAVAPADSFVTTVTWTAPTTAVGNITLYLAVNAINGNHMADMNDYSATKSIVLPAYSSSVSLAETANTATSVSISPNPANGIVSISYNGAETAYSVKVLDITGKVMAIEPCISKVSTTFDASAWPTGLYLVTITDGQQSITKQFQKN